MHCQLSSRDQDTSRRAIKFPSLDNGMPSGRFRIQELGGLQYQGFFDVF